MTLAAAQNYYQQAANALTSNIASGQQQATQNINQGNTALTQGTGTANSFLSPQTQGSYSALDSYFSALGIAVPQGGSSQLQAANQLGSQYNPNAINQLKTALQHIPNVGGSFGTAAAKQIQDAIASNDEKTMRALLEQYSKYSGNMASMAAAAKEGLAKYTPNSDAVLAQVATPQGQALLNTYQQAQSGQLPTATNVPQTPQMQANTSALNTANSNLQQLIANNPATMTGDQIQQLQSRLAATPGYQFALQQGLDQVQGSAAARGMLNSGQTMRGIADYTTGLASQTYNNYVNQYNSALTAAQNNVNSLASQHNSNISNLGTALGLTNAATQQSAQNAQQTAGLLNTNFNSLADLNMNSALATGNALSNLYSGLGSIAATQGSSPTGGDAGIMAGGVAGLMALGL